MFGEIDKSNPCNNNTVDNTTKKTLIRAKLMKNPTVDILKCARQHNFEEKEVVNLDKNNKQITEQMLIDSGYRGIIFQLLFNSNKYFIYATMSGLCSTLISCLIFIGLIIIKLL
jgi:hypothetical protein